MDDWLEGLIIAVIMIGIGVAIFKGGAANPVSTGGLRSKLSTLDADMRQIKSKVDGVQTKVDTVETRVAELDQRAATKGDIERIEQRLAGWDPRMDRLDDRLDSMEREIAAMQAMAAANQRVIEAMAESLRSNMAAIGNIERVVDANGTITKQVPNFMERVLTQIASTDAKTDAVCRQVDRLYDFITERGITK